MNQPSKRFNLWIVLLIILALGLIFGGFFTDDGTLSVSYSDVQSLFESGQVQAFLWEEGLLTLELREPFLEQTTVTHQLADVDMFQKELGELYRQQYRDGVIEYYEFVPLSEPSWLMQILPYALVMALGIFLMIRLMGRSGGSGGPGAQFGKAHYHTPNAQRPVTFRDVAGADEEKAELQEIIEFLKDPARFQAIGARVPHGVLLVGPPGTGKTLLAKAVAGEAGVPFLSISGSDFVELYVGIGASRVRDLFNEAKKQAPAILFIDEIDAVGRRRGSGMGGGHDEREQTLNQLLVEMDGFSGNDGVIVLAATNRQDILDPALLRPGRFDRHIHVNPPDVKGREEILRVHARKKPLAEDVDLQLIARATGGFTGADLANLLNEAALTAARSNRPVICREDVESSILKVIAGPEKRSHVNTQRDRRITAYHEAGHAVAMYRLPTADPVHQITIVPRGNALGLTVSLPDQDSKHLTRNQMRERIVSLLGGRVAEHLVFEDVTTGAVSDLQRASSLARDMVAKYGMCDRIGPVSYDDDDEVFIGGSYGRTRSYSEQTAGRIDDEVKQVIDNAWADCLEILRADRAKLDAVAAFLLENETMSRRQFEACMQDLPIPARGKSLLDNVAPEARE